MIIEWGMVPVGVGGGGGGTEPLDPPPHAATINATDAIDPNTRHDFGAQLILSSVAVAPPPR